MNEYRCTRPSVYGPKSSGFSDPSARQGYYVTAADEIAARSEVRKLCPERIGADDPIDVQLWKKDGVRV